jgi:homoserine dehydrogenase
MTMSSIPLRIGIFGAGIVGSGVINLIQRNIVSGKFNKLNVDIQIIKVCVKTLNKARDININPNPTSTSSTSSIEIVTSYDDILNDNTINVIIELIGGITNAKDIIFNAIKKGKHIITANKALIAAYLPEIQNLLKENPLVKYVYYIINNYIKIFIINCY